jgi:hypothetical protein
MVSALSQVQTGLRSYNGAPGFRFIKDIFPGYRQGGISYYPFSSIKSGFTPSWSLAAADPLAAAADVTVAIAPGSALLDGQNANLASSLNVTFTPEDLVTGDNYFRIFLNPTRTLQPVVSNGGVYTPPTTRLNGDPIEDGDLYAEAVDFPRELEAFAFYKRIQGAWTPFDPTFSAPAMPVQSGQKRTFGGECHSKVALGNISINAVEIPIYIAAGYPSFGYRPARAKLREPASLELVTAKLHYHVLPMALSVTFTNGSATAEVSYEHRSDFADVINSIVDLATLEVDGLAFTAYNAATGAITLSAAYAGTSGTNQVLLTPATPGEDFILSVNRSELSASTNLTNP